MTPWRRWRAVRFGIGRYWRAIWTLTLVTMVATVPAVVGLVAASQAAPAKSAPATSVSTLTAAAPPVASPGISAPPDVIAGEADGYLDLPVTLSVPGTSTVTVNYATST